MTTPERVRFADFEFRKLPSGSCEAKVVLEWEPGERYVGVAEGISSGTGALRCSAQAAVAALELAIQRKVTFELLGIKALRAFDATVIIVSLSSHSEDGSKRVVGSYLTDDGRERGAAIAVLNATNRLLGNFLARVNG